jgi:hypothetical protein
MNGTPLYPSYAKISFPLTETWKTPFVGQKTLRTTPIRSNWDTKLGWKITLCFTRNGGGSPFGNSKLLLDAN